MNTTVEPNYSNRLAAALAATRAPVRDLGGAAWGIESATSGLSIQGRATSDWLQLFVELPAPPAMADGAFLPAALLRWNRTLAGNARFSVNGQFVLALRAEVPVIDDLDPGPRLAEACDGIERGLAPCGEREGGTGDPPTGMTERQPALNSQRPNEGASAAVSPGESPGGTGQWPVLPAADITPLKSLAEAAGWAFHAREDGRLVFALDDADAALQASLESRPDGSVRAWTTLASLAGLNETSQRAVAVLLLRLGTTLRFARPVFIGEGDAASAELEVIFTTPPQPAELALALESLAVGASLAAAEAKLLCHEQTAKEFLIVGDWASREAHHDTTKGHA